MMKITDYTLQAMLLALAMTVSAMSFAGSGHRISIEVSEYEEPYILLGYYMGNRSYIHDTLRVNQNGLYVASGEEALTPGLYLVILPPENNYVDIVVAPGDQHFDVSLHSRDLNKTLQVKGSASNDRFLEYTRFLAEQRDVVKQFQTAKEHAGSAEDKEVMEQKIKEINDKVAAFQEKFLSHDPGNYVTRLIRATIDVVVPEPDDESLSEEDKQWWKYYYYRNHYWDNFDPGDPEMLRTPIMFNKINTYIERVTQRNPDSINASLDLVLEKMEKTAPESFRFYLIHYINEFARSNIVGMDAVYVHLVKNYYESGRAHWADPEQIERMVDNANKLEPLLIGRVAPDLVMEDKNGKQWQLHDIDAEYTILYFWDPDCGHCKRSAPQLSAFFEEFADRGVKIFSVCSKLTTQVPECWESVKEFGFDGFINVADAYHRSRYRMIYDLKSFPVLYVLNRDKIIVSKRIGVEQLKEVIEALKAAGV